MKIRFSTYGARRPAAERRAARAARLALRRGEAAGDELNLIWTTRVRLREMNRRFRGKRRFTDVIAFRYPPEGHLRRPSPFGRRPGTGPFGDVYIATDQARLNARRFGASTNEEIVRLAAHGTLHLLGFTDYTPRARERMWDVQEPIVRRVMGR